MRDNRIDILKCIAIVAVIAIHCSAPVFNLGDQVSAATWTTANIINAFSRFAVPLFVMASGAVILGRPETDVLEFYASRCKRLIPALVFWTFVYIGFVALTSKGFWAVGPLRWLAGAALAGEVYVHLWYIPMFIWLMLFSPYLNMTIVGKKPTRK